MMKRLAFVLLFATACGSSNSNPDAKVSIDAAPVAKTVSCAGATIAQTITVNAGGTAFVPQTVTVNVNDIVHFNTSASHPVGSGTGAPDGKFSSAGDSCVQFIAAGTYPFFCTVHGFTGTITVH